MSMFLTTAELIELTGKKHRKLQIGALSKMRLSSGEKIRYTIRPDSFPLVPRSQFEYLSAKKREPDFAALDQ